MICLCPLKGGKSQFSEVRAGKLSSKGGEMKARIIILILASIDLMI